MATGCDVLARQPIDSGKTLVPMLMAGADWSAGVRCYGAELEAGGLQPRRPPVVLCLYPFHALVQAQQREWQAFLDWLYREQLVEELPSAHFVNCPITGGRVASGSVPVQFRFGFRFGSAERATKFTLRYGRVACPVAVARAASRPLWRGAARRGPLGSRVALAVRLCDARLAWRLGLRLTSGRSLARRPARRGSGQRPACAAPASRHSRHVSAPQCYGAECSARRGAAGAAHDVARQNRSSDDSRSRGKPPFKHVFYIRRTHRASCGDCGRRHRPRSGRTEARRPLD